MAHLKDRVALVIGGAAGIGLASARMLCSEGAEVLIADRDGRAANAAAAEITAGGGAASGFKVDVSSMAQLRLLFDHVETRFGRLNVLFSNVGTRGPDGFDVTEAEFDETFDLSLKHHFFATNMALPLLRAGAPAASVIHMSSGAGLRFFGRSPLYCISKASLLMMTRAYARRFGPKGIGSMRSALVRWKRLSPVRVRTKHSTKRWSRPGASKSRCSGSRSQKTWRRWSPS